METTKENVYIVRLSEVEKNLIIECFKKVENYNDQQFLFMNDLSAQLDALSSPKRL